MIIYRAIKQTNIHELTINCICRQSSDEENSEKESSDEQHLDSDEIGKYFVLKPSCGIAAGLNFLYFFSDPGEVKKTIHSRKFRE